ncbi:MAG: Hsp70 family protein [Armatimonadetes bacterium]|nr:Hsp70 family protein [Armatimonadota bacterium]
MSYFSELMAARQNDVPDEAVTGIGIDLGTTNSTVAEASWDPNQPESVQVRCLDIPQETLNAGNTTSPLFPSVVAVLPNRVLVGEGAKRLRAESTEYNLLPYRDLFYECKNEMGITRTYNQAPEGFRCARDIAAKVLGCLVETLRDDTAIQRAVVTVPASFQVPQRSDTVEAAREAGIQIMPGDLLDEPIGAFLTFLNGLPDEDPLQRCGSSRLVVFDFGGGTCDIAVLQLTRQSPERPISVAPLAVSRYHRLGGGDIDNSIVHEVLIPALLEANGISSSEIEFKERKYFLEPALLGVAESLKISLCNSVRRLKDFKRFDPTDTDRHTAVLPSSHQCVLNGRQLLLPSPSLTLEQFEAILAPFLDEDITVPIEGDYGVTCSIFAPLDDALARSNLRPTDVDTVLLVGGSSLIPQVVEALEQHLGPQAQVRTFDDHGQIQTAVAEGAALHSLALRLFGAGLIQPVLSDSIGLRTRDGILTLIPKGEAVPYPADGWGQIDTLSIPETAESLDLRIDLTADDGRAQRRLQSAIWRISGPVTKGESLVVQYHMDDNQMLAIRAFRAGAPGSPFGLTVERPLTHVVDPNETRGKIIEIEEKIRTGDYAGWARVAAFRELAVLCAEVRQFERALSHLKTANTIAGTPQPGLLNLAGIYAGRLGDHKREETFYTAAAQAGTNWGGPLFNLADSLEHRGELQKARLLVEQALEREREAGYLVLYAKILSGQGDKDGRDAALSQALETFGPVEALEDWEVGWLRLAARMVGDNKLLSACDEESRRRKMGGNGEDGGGVLPIGPSGKE